MTTQTLDDLLDEFETCAYQSCFSMCDELRVKIKEALAQPEKPQPDRITTLRQLTENHSVDCLCADCVELDDIEEALAQPELCKYGQEPKSCTSSTMDCQCALDATFAQPEQEPDDMTIAYMAGLIRGKDLAPQRTWVGLSQEDFIYFCSYVRSDVLSEIEAKLKELNT